MPRRSSPLCGCVCLTRRSFLGGFVAFAASDAHAQSPLCPAEKAAVVVRRNAKAPTYDYSLAVADLARISAERAGPKGLLTQHGKRPAGLTTVNYQTSWLITMDSRRDGRRSCVKPSKIVVDVAIVQHQVYVARDATQVATCHRDVILEHENRHVRINFECIEDVRRRTEQTLAAFIPTLPTMEGESVDLKVVSERYNQLVARPIADAFEGAFAVAKARHALMDSNEAYARDWGKCG